MNAKKTEYVTLCLTKQERRKADAIAKKERRKTGALLSLVVSDWLKGKRTK